MTSYKIFQLAYAENLVNRYQQLAGLPGFVLLETSDRTQGRYDIASAYPYDRVKIQSDVSCVNKAFAKLQAFIPTTTSILDIPFQGGAIGYFSYDLGTKLENISSLPQNSLKGMPWLNFGLYDWAIISDHKLKKAILFSANTRPETAGIVDEILTRWHSCEPKREMFRLRGPFVPLISKASYREAFQSIHNDLQKGRCYQVNYTQPFNAPYVGDPWELYKQIRSQNPVPYSAFLHYEEEDILSFSPERFLLQDQERLLTSPIKGTERRVREIEEDRQLRQRLLASEKNLAENVMIVDLLRNDLGKIAKPGSVQVKSLCEVQSFKAVHHLVSHIEALRRDDVVAVEAFKACFPGGSITGAPKLESMRVIAEQELYSRGLYCGNIAYFSYHGRSDSNIAIRTITARNQILHLAAGGGIVIDSNWEDEYRECLTKIAAITNVLNKDKQTRFAKNSVCSSRA
ncbi:para-aminobenzoate synthetase component I [Legionella lansingensis]|uniref:aminodeoxychorismate synthase n=1 Tax=Legionella lansingensis TaxID=45067 RepID=A0A0W0VJL9_9GAMM|nr:aminodeoxychorismate synthase component I [Legionella lansingensis]KTD20298.1 para-aminobenzoate synthase component I [Legionella lansingensis]SNV50355.1 para-aminobenzoate synthetase component I [Legionella lansingensis]